MVDISIFYNHPIFYISPDIRRALGLELILPNYYIVCSFYEPLVDLVREKGGNVFCLEELVGKEGVGNISNTGQLLAQKEVQDFISKVSSKNIPNILFFKPSPKIDIVCQQKGYKKLGNDSHYNQLFENKISFFQMTKEHLSEFHVEGEVGILGKCDFTLLSQKIGTPFVLQFGQGWAGKTTFVIKDENEFKSLKEKYPETNIKVSKYIKGITALNNCCIYDDQVLIGEEALQLSGLKELSEKETITCGRQWPMEELSISQKKIIRELSYKTGILMKEKGYKGYFGLDFLISEEDGRIYLSEDNARFTASTPFYTKREIGYDRIPLMMYHIASFLDLKLERIDIGKEITGSQVIIRNTEKKTITIKDTLKTGIYTLDPILQFKTNSYEVNQLQENDLLIIPERVGKLVEENEEIARIETKNKVFRGGRLTTRVLELIVKIKEILN